MNVKNTLVELFVPQLWRANELIDWCDIYTIVSDTKPKEYGYNCSGLKHNKTQL